MMVDQIRERFTNVLSAKHFVVLPNGTRTIEIMNACFVANEPTILGDVNHDYVQRELAWYDSQSLNVNDIPGGAPTTWKRVATPGGLINSNYGWMIYSTENGSQYDNVLAELSKDPSSRRAVMIYTRPSMHLDQNTGGMQDFACTNTVQYLIRHDELHCIVNMRSNDAVFGYRNDWAWQDLVLRKLAKDLRVGVGDIYWNAGSLHFYEQHFYMVDHFAKTGAVGGITKEQYRKAYPDSEWSK